MHEPFQRDDPSHPSAFQRVVGGSPAIRELKRLLTRIAASPATTVLLFGESGTGKGLLAEEIHRCSPRAQRPFQLICCSALPTTLLESELFGHEAGAFTDARRRKRGLIEVADGGTVFLDEIGEIGHALQVKLLTFLESQRFKRVGGTEDLEVDVRIVAATNKDLARAVREGSFRPDLYYRLNVLPVRVPSLRERLEDLPPLVDHFIGVFNEKYRKRVAGVSPRGLEALAHYPWPGNVREVKNLVERAMLLTEAEVLQPQDFVTPSDRLAEPRTFTLPPEGLDLQRLESDLLVQALERCGGNQTRAAELLGLTRHQIGYRMRKLGLRADRSAAAAGHRRPRSDLRPLAPAAVRPFRTPSSITTPAIGSDGAPAKRRHGGRPS